jgi:hypothetical protein
MSQMRDNQTRNVWNTDKKMIDYDIAMSFPYIFIPFSLSSLGVEKKLKSGRYWKHQIVATATYVGLILGMVVTRPFMNESKWRSVEDRVFGWLERGHVDK